MKKNKKLIVNISMTLESKVYNKKEMERILTASLNNIAGYTDSLSIRIDNITAK